MDDTLLKQIQQTELEIASEIFRICRKHQLRCSLVGGSAIGAVRHHGFIPWDDDIDLAMPRKDYERFSSLCKEELSENYFLQDFDTEENCAYIFAKVRKNDTYMPEEYSKHIKMHQGIWVDVFIYDNVSDNPKIRKREINQLALYRNLLILKTGFRMPRNKSGFFNRAVLYPIGKCCSSFFDASYLKRKCRQIMTRHQN